MESVIPVLGVHPSERDMNGRRIACVGTLMMKTRALVTIPGNHAMQRDAWIEEVNAKRIANGKPPLTVREVEEETTNVVDLLFDDRFVLIRPEPSAMGVRLALEADALLQRHGFAVSKREIRFLNTKHDVVRNALRARGENWRMSWQPTSAAHIVQLITESICALECQPIYFYNRSAGIRFLSHSHFSGLEALPDDEFRRQMHEIALYSTKYNRFKNPEIEVFPQDCSFSKRSFKKMKDAENMPIDELRAVYRSLLADFSKAVPDKLYNESIGNIEWRNHMCSALMWQPNATNEGNIVQGISPVFYQQIEWLPGCRIDKGEIIFDPICDELESKPDDPELFSFCDLRAKSIIFNYIRECSTIEYINIGRIGYSMSLTRSPDAARSAVYIVQLKEASKPEPEVRILRFQKWGVKEHLDAADCESLLSAIMQSMEYTDYVLDRRLGCRQLGMNLPDWLFTGRIAEVYKGKNTELHGALFWSVYFERAYVPGDATDKILPDCYADPEFNRRFARLLGEAAAVNCIVGRGNLRKSVIFDDGDEVIALDANGLPERLTVSDHTGSFALYDQPITYGAKSYAKPVNSRAKLGKIPNTAEFADEYLSAFRTRFEQVQQEYRDHKNAFDGLFKHRTNKDPGSPSDRWKKLLARLDGADAAEVVQAIRDHIKIGTPAP